MTSRKQTTAKKPAPPASRSATSRGVMGNALSASMDAEKDSFQARLDKAEMALKPVQPAAQPKKPKAEKSPPPPPTPHVVRDAFTMPEGDYALIEQTQKRCLDNAVNITKAEALRAGLQALSKLTDKQLLAQIENLEKVPVGRPKTSKHREQ